MYMQRVRQASSMLLWVATPQPLPSHTLQNGFELQPVQDKTAYNSVA